MSLLNRLLAVFSLTFLVFGAAAQDCSVNPTHCVDEPKRFSCITPPCPFYSVSGQCEEKPDLMSRFCCRSVVKSCFSIADTNVLVGHQPPKGFCKAIMPIVWEFDINALMKALGRRRLSDSNQIDDEGFELDYRQGGFELADRGGDEQAEEVKEVVSKGGAVEELRKGLADLKATLIKHKDIEFFHTMSTDPAFILDNLAAVLSLLGLTKDSDVTELQSLIIEYFDHLVKQNIPTACVDAPANQVSESSTAMVADSKVSCGQIIGTFVSFLVPTLFVPADATKASEKGLFTIKSTPTLWGSHVLNFFKLFSGAFQRIVQESKSTKFTSKTFVEFLGKTFEEVTPQESALGVLESPIPFLLHVADSLILNLSKENATITLVNLLGPIESIYKDVLQCSDKPLMQDAANFMLQCKDGLESIKTCEEASKYLDCDFANDGPLSSSLIADICPKTATAKCKLEPGIVGDQRPGLEARLASCFETTSTAEPKTDTISLLSTTGGSDTGSTSGSTDAHIAALRSTAILTALFLTSGHCMS